MLHSDGVELVTQKKLLLIKVWIESIIPRTDTEKSCTMVKVSGSESNLIILF